MNDSTTSVSLLRRLQKPDENAAWDRFVELYTPMVHGWIRRQGLSEADADDLTQDVVTVMVQKLPEFEYSPEKSFRGWLRTVAINKTRDFFRRQSTRKEVGEVPHAEPVIEPEHLEFIEAAEYRAQLVGRALRIMKADFQPATWQACWQSLCEERPAEEIAADLSISVNAVYINK